MQSDDVPDDHSHPKGPVAPFDFVPSSATSRDDPGLAGSRDGPLAGAIDDNPDDFYRPFADRPYHPDIVVEYHQNAMSTTAKRKAPHLNGTASKSSSLPVSATARSSLRSASGPASPLGGAKSSPNLSTAAKVQPGSIKDRIRQFEQVRGGGPVRSGSRGGRARAASASKLSAASQSPAGGSRNLRGGGHVASRQRGGANSAGRQPLFGEVVNADTIEEDPGYGISGVTKPHTDEIQGSMHHPNPMFTRSRSYSTNELSPEAASVPGPLPEIASHSRSQSDNSPTAQTFTSRLSPPSSRIPTKARRASDIGPRKGTITPPIKGGPEPSSRSLSPQNAVTSHQRARLSPSSPSSTLSPRRYNPKKAVEPSQTLNAVVKAPLPKYSPPLRSSRPRQPVSTATTSASRAKVSDRYVRPGSNGPSRDSPSPADNRSKTKAITTGVDVAVRRAKLQHKLQGDLSKEHKPPQEKAMVLKTSGNDDGPTETNQDLPVLEPIAYQPHRDVPELSLNTSDSVLPQSSPQSAATDTPHTDIDESPLVGLNDSYPSLSAPNKRENNLLKQIMEIRDGSAETTPRTQNVEDFLSEKDDSETIQVVLGTTPVLPEVNWKDPDTPSEFLSPIPDQGEEEGIFLDNRSSLRPDDSVSMVFRRNYREDSEPVPPVPTLPPPLESSREESGLDGEARSVLTWALGQYRSGLITPDKAYEFQRQVEEMAPQLPQHDAWESPAATQSYLQSVLAFYASSDPRAERSARQSAEQEAIPITMDESPENEEPGIAIIYGQPQRYSRDSISSMDRGFTQHNHTASNSTLRPSHLDDDGTVSPLHQNQADTRPAPPPKDLGGITDRYFTGSGPYQDGQESPLHPRLPEPSTTGDGLGLSIDTDVPITPPSQHPPAPNHAPPPPPTPKFIPFGTQSQYRASVSSSVYGRDSFASPPAASPRNLPRPAPVDSMLQDSNTFDKPSLDMVRSDEASRSASIDTNWKEVPNGAPTSPIQKEKEKQLKERRHLIKELVDTESSYCQDMTIMEDIYMGTACTVLSETDRRVLFGNLDQVRTFSVEFLDELRQTAAAVYVIPRENRWNAKRGSIGTSHSGGADNSTINGTPSDKELHALDAETAIGQSFLKHLGRIEKVYGEWIKSNDAANQRLKELQPDHTVNLWLEECHSSAKDITHAWSLDALIIKPTQRLTKYPLLLQGLLKCTPSDHPDYLALKQAHDDLHATIRRINDAKKRAELVDQAMNRKRKDSESKMKVGKLLNRRAERLKQQVGFSNAADDQSYEAIAQKFGGHFFQLQIVMRDIEKYLEDLQTSTNFLNNFTRSVVQYCQLESHERWPEYESNWIAFGQAMQGITNIALSAHVCLHPLFTHVITNSRSGRESAQIRYRADSDPLETARGSAKDDAKTQKALVGSCSIQNRDPEGRKAGQTPPTG